MEILTNREAVAFHSYAESFQDLTNAAQMRVVATTTVDVTSEERLRVFTNLDNILKEAIEKIKEF